MSNKNIAILAVILLVIGLGVGIFFYSKNKDDTKKIDEGETPDETGKADLAGDINSGGSGFETGPSGEAPENPAPSQPAPTPDNPPNNNGSDSQSQLYDIDSGAGLAAINKRIAQIYKDKAKLMSSLTANGVENDPYKNLTYKSSWQNLVGDKFGGAFDYIPPPLAVKPKALQVLRATAEMEPTFELRHQQRGFDEALQDLLRFADLREAGGPLLISSLDENTEPVIRQIVTGYFGDSSRADKNRSETYDQFEQDLKKIAANWLEMQKQVEAALTLSAIEDLRASGWKFFGYDQP